jgi:hypothetical protein
MRGAQRPNGLKEPSQLLGPKQSLHACASDHHFFRQTDRLRCVRRHMVDRMRMNSILIPQPLATSCWTRRVPSYQLPPPNDRSICRGPFNSIVRGLQSPIGDRHLSRRRPAWIYPSVHMALGATSHASLLPCLACTCMRFRCSCCCGTQINSKAAQATSQFIHFPCSPLPACLQDASGRPASVLSSPALATSLACLPASVHP